MRVLACHGVWELRMSNLEVADSRLTFEDLLEAVQDSKRGRWFLNEYEARIQKRDTQSILGAISKLENRMEQFGPQGAGQDDLTKVRSAIAQARNDLLTLGMGQEAMSKEGRLFAKMAEMAKKSMPESAEQNAGIVRTLQLVDEIDRAISPTQSDDKGAKFFAANSNLFDRPAIIKPTLVEVVAPAPQLAEPPKAVVVEPLAPVAKKEEPAATGARLVIRKAGTANSTAPTETEVEPAAPTTLSIPAVETPKPETLVSDNPRIVIIRRKAEDMPEVSVGQESAA